MEPLKDYQLQLLDAIESNPGISCESLSRLLGITRIDAHSRAIVLWRLELIQVKGSFNPSCYAKRKAIVILRQLAA